MSTTDCDLSACRTRGMDRLLNIVPGGGDGVVYADSIRPAVPQQLFDSLERMWLHQLGRWDEFITPSQLTAIARMRLAKFA